MTYCLGMLLNEGLVMIADTRTNAGIDNFSSFKKLHTLADGPDRQIFACSSGSLSISQSVIGLIQEGLPAADGGEMNRNLSGVTSMFRAAQLVGEAVQAANRTVGAALAAINLSSSASLLLGGRIGNAPPALFQIYSAGNFIECTTDTPYLQIGEHKYGKPVLDRAVTYGVDLYDALKIGLISMDSTMRSNLGVGMPIDILVARRDVCDAELSYRIEPGEPYFHDLRERWSSALRAAHNAIPRPPYAGAG